MRDSLGVGGDLVVLGVTHVHESRFEWIQNSFNESHLLVRSSVLDQDLARGQS